jgi:hypothetical protein
MATNDALKNKQIRVRISQNYHQEPIISRLVSDYGLVINIRAAILGANSVGDGWFDLDLQGANQQIENALAYLHDLKLEIWDNSDKGGW